MSNSNLILPSLRGVVGDWIYYSTLMTAQQIYEWIKTEKEIRETVLRDEESRRDFNKRKKRISDYLLQDPSRFFNSIVVGVFSGNPDWREFDLSRVQAEYGDTLDRGYIKESLGLLIFNGNEKMFAIDGYHRITGIHLAYAKESKKAQIDKILKDDQFPVIFVRHTNDSSGRKRTRKLFLEMNRKIDF